jgi:hypothetical protein
MAYNSYRPWLAQFIITSSQGSESQLNKPKLQLHKSLQMIHNIFVKPISSTIFYQLSLGPE